MFIFLRYSFFLSEIVFFFQISLVLYPSAHSIHFSVFWKCCTSSIVLYVFLQISQYLPVIEASEDIYVLINYNGGKKKNIKRGNKNCGVCQLGHESLNKGK